MVRTGLALLLALYLLAREVQAQEKASGPPSIEARLLEALRDGKPRMVRAIGEEITELDTAKRRELAVRVRPDVVEFRFTGEFPADRLAPAMLEYIVSSADKDYESLLIVDKSELKRVQRLGEALMAMKMRGPKPALEVKLVWSEERGSRMEDLRDILRLAGTGKAEEFLERLEVNASGLEAFNLQADPATLPAKRGPAMVVVSVRLPAP